MTELLDDTAEVRQEPDGSLSLRTPAGWQQLEVVNSWRVETDWWRIPARRDYVRCLLTNGSCVELYRDLSDGSWHLSRRYD